MPRATEPVRLSEREIERIVEVARPLFAAAVAQALHAPFELDTEYWGQEYADRLAGELEDPDAS